MVAEDELSVSDDHVCYGTVDCLVAQVFAIDGVELQRQLLLLGTKQSNQSLRNNLRALDFGPASQKSSFKEPGELGTAFHL